MAVLSKQCKISYGVLGIELMMKGMIGHLTTRVQGQLIIISNLNLYFGYTVPLFVL
jgi:hypothetical protein